MGTINMLGLAKRVHARVLLTSTSEVYGDPEQHPQTESCRATSIRSMLRSCYNEGKRVAECLMIDYHRQNKLSQPPDSHIVHSVYFGSHGNRVHFNLDDCCALIARRLQNDSRVDPFHNLIRGQILNNGTAPLFTPHRPWFGP
jgi:hypothetical protein